MLLSQQAVLVRLDGQRAVVRVSSNWMPMVQSRLPLLEAAVGKALGSPRQLVLEGGDPTALQQSPTPTPAPPQPAGTTQNQKRLPEQEPQPPGAPTVRPRPADEAQASAAMAIPEEREVGRPSAPEPEIAPPLAAPQANGTASDAPRATTGDRQIQQLDEKAKRLAEFFNGEVISLDDPLGDGDAVA